tara:strand:+ start:44 stop:433 length:390 start_codon:yes stop_codon:yes gene_type:complete
MASTTFSRESIFGRYGDVVDDRFLLDEDTQNKLQKRVETLFSILHGAEFKTITRLLRLSSQKPLTNKQMKEFKKYVIENLQHRHAQADGVDWSVGYLGSIWHDCKLGRIALYEPNDNSGGAWYVVLCNY